MRRPTPAVLHTIVRALENAKGDDLYRAQHAFNHLTSEEMDRPWGGNGETPRQILAGYREHNDRIKVALDWVMGGKDASES